MLFLFSPSTLLASNNAIKDISPTKATTELFTPTLYLKSIDEFEPKGKSKEGIRGYTTYALKSEPNVLFLIKGKSEQDVLRDFLGAFIAREIIGNRAPFNYIVRLKNGKIALATKIITGFVSYNNYLDKLSTIDPQVTKLDRKYCLKLKLDTIYGHKVQKVIAPTCRTDYLPARELQCSKNIVELNLLARFIYHADYHPYNVGFIVRDGRIIDSALVDFDSAFISEGINFAPPFNYYAGVAEAINSLKLICAFNTASLKKLVPLFEQLNEKAFLTEIIKMMEQQVVNFKNQLKACEIVNRLVAGDLFDTEIEQLINLESTQRILSNFTLENGENIVINILADKKDLLHIAKMLALDEELIQCFIVYCLKYSQHELLYNLCQELNETLSNKLINELLDQIQTKEHLEAILKIIEKRAQYVKLHLLIKNTIEDDFALANLLQIFGRYSNNVEEGASHVKTSETYFGKISQVFYRFYIGSKEHKSFGEDSEIYINLVRRLMIICLKERYNNEIGKLDNSKDRGTFMHATWDYYLLQEDDLNIFNKYAKRLANSLIELVVTLVILRDCKSLEEVKRVVFNKVDRPLASQSDITTYDILDLKKKLEELFAEVLKDIESQQQNNICGEG